MTDHSDIDGKVKDWALNDWFHTFAAVKLARLLAFGALDSSLNFFKWFK